MRPIFKYNQAVLTKDRVWNESNALFTHSNIYIYIMYSEYTQYIYVYFVYIQNTLYILYIYKKIQWIMDLIST
jgi:hypothetical protein